MSTETTAQTATLGREQLAQKVAADIAPGAYVNLGIGQPTKVSDYLDPEQGVTLHTENGMLGMGPEAHGDDVDADLINAGKIPVTETAGTSYFHHADSFAMMRGGHLDVCVLGAFQVSAAGDLANWSTGAPDAIPAVGGAMDLATGARDVFVMMSLFAKDGSPKIVPALTYPATGLGCVTRVYTDHGIFLLSTDDDGAAVVTLREAYGLSPAEIAERLEVEVVDATASAG
ncbi:CoA-transferase [Nesterenkonia aerolata]|uniref:CoA-transferase n=1 Tax=Nesterenkonia aerolata TaxID=3074079 RepID=A0ABU2DU67_9MICC|nr:CoA-transferase [Nesterenkonia sp. LY-0111]MDR8019941.1 CoA-transferase [Nesterenkonia sp. LY-0111]